MLSPRPLQVNNLSPPSPLPLLRLDVTSGLPLCLDYEDTGTLDYLKEGVRGDLEGQAQQVLMDAPVPSHVLQGQALLAGSLPMGGRAS